MYLVRALVSITSWAEGALFRLKGQGYYNLVYEAPLCYDYYIREEKRGEKRRRGEERGENRRKEEKRGKERRGTLQHLHVKWSKT